MTGWMRKGGIALLLGLAGCQTVPRTAAPDVVAPVFPASSAEVDQRSAAERTRIPASLCNATWSSVMSACRLVT